MKTLSVIIPVYQAEKTLEACVLSVADQEMQPQELLLVDDGSLDGTIGIAERLEKEIPFIRLICQDHGGVSEARNRGIREARGEWILFLDADDLLLPGALRALAESIQEGTDAYCGKILRGNEKIISNQGKTVFLPGGSRLLNEALAAPTDLLTVHGWIFRRRLCEAVAFRPDLRLGEDSEWVLRVLSACRGAAMIPAPVYRYTISAESAIHQWKPGIADEYLKTLTAINGTQVSGEKNWPVFVLTTLLLILTHDTFHPANPGDRKAQKQEALHLRKLPVFQAALREADYSVLDTGRRITLMCMKAGWIVPVRAAVKFRQRWNACRM